MLVTIRFVCRGLLSAAICCLRRSCTRAGGRRRHRKVTKLPPVSEESESSEARRDESRCAGRPRCFANGQDVENRCRQKDAQVRRQAKNKLKQLSQEMAERRDRVRRLITALRQQPFNTQQNDCAEILEFCRGFGCNTELFDNAGSGQKVNGITCLCWNMPCGGYDMMTVSEGHLAGRIGYGCQSEPSELAAVLALSEVPANYPARCGKLIRNVADLIEYEKLTCRAGSGHVAEARGPFALRPRAFVERQSGQRVDACGGWWPRS